MLRTLLILLFLTSSAVAGSKEYTFISADIANYDGDTIAFGDVHFRLSGIDAPELKQTCYAANKRSYACGKLAKEYLAGLIARYPVLTCTMLTTKKGTFRLTWGRPIASCVAPDGVDISKQMVVAGMAVAYVKYGKQYLPEQIAARAAHIGIWQGKFVLPECFRRKNLCKKP